MSDISSLSSQLANANNAAQARAAVRPEAPPPLTVHNAVAATLNSPQSAVLQAPLADKADWQHQAHADGRHRQDAHADAESDTPTFEQITELLKRINQQLHQHQTPLQFELIGDAAQWQIQIVDKNTHNLVRYISWPETRTFARALEECTARQAPAKLNQYAQSANHEQLHLEGGLLQVTI